MTKAQCYYEILGLEETATSDEIKKAYRNLALVWHPDKNQANRDEAHSKFQCILKAYETLSDSKERNWYDRHRDQILSEGTDNKDGQDLVNLFQYFSSACYANFDDSDDGFYTIYRTVFDKMVEEEQRAYQIAAKLSKAKDKQAPEYPSFGNSKSDYDDIVKPFYAYWSGFCTYLTFDHLDKYNTTEAENRRILRAMEKENKKIKEQARKERNTNVRNLVEFVKKRDKRLKAHKRLVEEQNKLNREKTAEKQRQQREKCLKESSEYKPTSWEDINDIEEQLRQLESQYDIQETCRKRNKNRDCYNQKDLNDTDYVENSNQEFSSDLKEREDEERQNNDDSNDESEEEEEPEFYCPACSKDFKSIKAFENHEASKKHKQNVAKLTKLLQNEEKKLYSNEQ